MVMSMQWTNFRIAVSGRWGMQRFSESCRGREQAGKEANNSVMVAMAFLFLKGRLAQTLVTSIFATLARSCLRNKSYRVAGHFRVPKHTDSLQEYLCGVRQLAASQLESEMPSVIRTTDRSFGLCRSCKCVKALYKVTSLCQFGHKLLHKVASVITSISALSLFDILLWQIAPDALWESLPLQSRVCGMADTTAKDDDQ
eukprot:782178-Amphidinium_carterae.1